MTWQTGLSLGAAGIVLVAIMLAWNAGLVCGRYDSIPRRRLRLMLKIAASVSLGCAMIMFLVALFDGSVVAVVVSIFMLLFLCGVIFLLVWMQLRITRRQSLIWMLSAAAEKGVPLHDAAHAFADENDGDMLSKNLSMFLQAGAPLPEAVRLSGVRLPMDAHLAVEAGYRLQLLGPLMQRLMGDANNVEGLIREAVERIWYFLAISLITTGIFLFFVMRVLASLGKIVADFGLTNVSGLTSSQFVSASAGWVGLMMFMMVVILGVASIIGGLYYIGAMPANFPGLGTLAARLDSARILRVLGIASENQRSLQDTLRVLTLYYPRGAVRARLHRAGEMVSAGGNWITSLMQQGLITQADAAVMQSAQRAGNLGWAMNDLSATSMQRFSHRFRLVISIVFPVLSCLTGLLVLMFVLALFGPLVTMIEALS